VHLAGGEIKTVKSVLCSVIAVLVRAKYVCLYKICVILGDSTYKLNAFIFALKTGIAPYTDEE